jgi:hypothetical protein
METNGKIMTLAQFAKKNGLSRATVWRWTKRKDLKKRFKMYDAKEIKIAGKPFIEVSNEK